MEKSIYLLSAQPYSGKSLITVGLGLKLKDAGYRVGYFKPFGRAVKKVDEDADSVKKALALGEPLEQICPLLVTEEMIKNILCGSNKENFSEKIANGFNQVAKGKDLILIDGAGNLSEGCLFDLPVEKMVKITQSKVLFVFKNEQGLDIDQILAVKEIFKDNFLGAVINFISGREMDYFREAVVPYLGKKKIEIFALFPKDVLLSVVTVKEIVEHLHAKVLSGEDKLDELVENFTVGAMHPEHALRYFRKIANKAVITGGDRADIQLAALETSTKCLILTGNLSPDSLVLCKAMDLGIPVLLVPYDTYTTVEMIEEITKRIPFHGEKKITRVKELFKMNFDFEKFKTVLGL